MVLTHETILWGEFKERKFDILAQMVHYERTALFIAEVVLSIEIPFQSSENGGKHKRGHSLIM